MKAKVIRKKVPLGVGIMDMENESRSKCGYVWKNMIARCYNPTEVEKHPTYKDCG